MDIKLEAKNGMEARILTYLQENASEVLSGKINSGSKTLAGAMKYAKDQAQKLDHPDGGVFVDDDTVFGWIIHFFEEDSIEEAKPRPKVIMPAGVKVKPSSVPVYPLKPVDPQLDMFSMVGGVQPKPEPVVEEAGDEPEQEDQDAETDEGGEPDPF
jgi:hypothetical protein